jgi:butyrate kinase
MIKEGTYKKPERPKNSVPPGQRGSDTKQAQKAAEGKRKMETKLEKIVALCIIGISVVAIGTVGAIGYLARRDGQEAKFSLYQKACLNLKDDAVNTAKLHEDETMQLLLERGGLCSGQSYDDMKAVQRDKGLLGIYIKYKK